MTINLERSSAVIVTHLGKSMTHSVLLKTEHNSNMELNTGSNLQANGLSAGADSLSKIELLVLRNEVISLRDRVANLERQLANIKQSEHRFEETCVFCHELHSIRHCDYFKYLQVTDRWNVAKKLNLCYRCLEKSHHGLDCPHTKKCGVNRCRLTHNELLHNEEKRINRRMAKRQESEVVSLFGSTGSGHGIQNESGYIVSDATPEMSEYNSQVDTGHGAGSRIDSNLLDGECDSSPRISTAVTCDGNTDSANLVELNRLAMLAETDVKLPFDLIFGGSCGNELGSSQSRNTASISFGAHNLKDKFSDLTGQNNLTDKMEDLPASAPSSENSNLDSSYNEYVDPAVKHPCPLEVVVNFNHENASANYETDSDVNSLDPIAPGGYDPFRPSGGENNLDSFNMENFASESKFVPKESLSVKNDTDHLHSESDDLDLLSGLSESVKSTDFRTESVTSMEELESSDRAGKQGAAAPSGGKEPNDRTTAEPSGGVKSNDYNSLEDNNEERSNRNNDAQGAEPTFAVKLEQLIKKCGQDKILEVLSNQLHMLDKEIKLCENALSTSPAPPAEELHEKQSPSNKPEVDLSVWLMPSAES